jgi:predicted O-methyltransferase YrrM
MPSIASAQRLTRAGRHADALREYERLTAEAATRPDALGNRAWLLRSLGRFEESLADYDALLLARPDDPNVRGVRAETLSLLGRNREALEAALDALRRNPLGTTATTVIARCQAALGAVPVPPKVQSNTQTEPVRPLNSVIEALERDPRSYPTSSFPEVGRFLYSFVRLIRPRLALETGCYIGYSTLCIAQALQENGGGHLHSFDLFTELPDYESPVLGPQTNALTVARGHLDEAGLGPRVTFHPGDSSATIAREFAGAEPAFDFAFIDGDHSIRGCLKDWAAVDRLIAPGGFVLLHDTVPDRCAWLGPRYLIEELAVRAPSQYQWVNLPSPEGFGIAVIQKKAAGLAPTWKPALLDLLTDRLSGHKRLR